MAGSQADRHWAAALALAARLRPSHRSWLCWPGNDPLALALRTSGCSFPAPTATCWPSGCCWWSAGAGQLAGFHRRLVRHRAGRRCSRVGGGTPAAVVHWPWPAGSGPRRPLLRWWLRLAPSARGTPAAAGSAAAWGGIAPGPELGERLRHAGRKRLGIGETALGLTRGDKLRSSNGASGERRRTCSRSRVSLGAAWWRCRARLEFVRGLRTKVMADNRRPANAAAGVGSAAAIPTGGSGGALHPTATWLRHRRLRPGEFPVPENKRPPLRSGSEPPRVCGGGAHALARKKPTAGPQSGPPIRPQRESSNVQGDQPFP